MSEKLETVLDFLKVFGLVLLAFIGGLMARPAIEGFWDGYEAARQSQQGSEAEGSREEETADIQP
ncbi:MAG: hypothetical protein GVY32_07165 [Gammaproteobacteria bacterium]|jgi:hypothetical protein|nr:hypothetical protein [Gammaproteobacteria bacterium]